MDVIIGIDPHKSSHTAVALDTAGQRLAELRVAANKDQCLAASEVRGAMAQRRWAVDGANGLGRLLAQQLIAAGEQVIDVSAMLSARVRLVSGGSARKSTDTTPGRPRSPHFTVGCARLALRRRRGAADAVRSP